jgi:hypothetical protein
VRLVENWAGPSRLISTDGLGHRRLLTDPGVVRDVMGFVRAGSGTVQRPADRSA